MTVLIFKMNGDWIDRFIKLKINCSFKIEILIEIYKTIKPNTK